MTTLSEAIEREQWELAALMLLVRAVETMEAMPYASIDDVIELMAADPELAPRSTGRMHWRRNEARRRHTRR